MPLRSKILLLATSGILFTGLLVVAAVLYQETRLDQQVTDEMNAMARSECAKIARDVYLMLRVQDEGIRRRLQSNLNVADSLVDQAGGVTFSKGTVTWDAINPSTKQRRQVVLPKMLVGGKWLGQNRDGQKPSPVVDKLQSLVGDTCTIYQRMDETGDMLSVCTNIRQSDGSRAIGTYLPTIEANGQPNPIIQTVLRGETYVGRAYVVNDWYLTAYQPIFNAKKQVVGLMYVGVPQEGFPELRRGIMDIVVGKTGYVSLLGASGDKRGTYLLSHKGQRDGENIWNSTDATGYPFIQAMVNKAKNTKQGECVFERYPWRNGGDDKSHWKIAAATYFEPWDCVITVGADEADFHESRDRVSAALNRIVSWSILSAVGALILMQRSDRVRLQTHHRAAGTRRGDDGRRRPRKLQPAAADRREGRDGPAGRGHQHGRRGHGKQQCKK